MPTGVYPRKEGSHSNNWKGGRIIANGYILIYKPKHPFCTYCRYVLEHRLVMEKHLGRYLTPEEIVHHKGIRFPVGSIKNRQDNKIENLQLFPNDIKHKKFHAINNPIFAKGHKFIGGEKGWFKKGFVSWNKGKKTGLVPKNAFKKGHTPWNKK